MILRTNDDLQDLLLEKRLRMLRKAAQSGEWGKFVTVDQLREALSREDGA